MNSLYFTLNKQIDANYLLKNIQRLLQKHGDTKNCIMKIEILEISKEDNSLIPKLEYKP
jgi:enamine deaminase RidA (YjgF/YER057c/UK114 family)